MIVDAHQHYWAASEFHGLEGPHEPDDLRGALSAAGVDATVLVQAVDEGAENERLAAYARATPTVAGVVAWPGAPFREIPRLVGVRSLAARDQFDFELPEDLVLDVVPIAAEHVQAVCALADARPAQRIVVDHLARPPLDGGDWGAWEDGIRALAARPNVAMKVSVGVAVLAHWKWDGDALARPVDHALDCFGTERLMLASNWPVVLMRSSYLEAWADLAGAVGHDPDVLGQTAARWYRVQT